MSNYPKLEGALASVRANYAIKEGIAKGGHVLSEDAGGASAGGAVGGATAGATSAGGVATGGGEALGVGLVKRGINAPKPSKSPIPGSKRKKGRSIYKEGSMRFPYPRDKVAYEMNLRLQGLTTLEGCPEKVEVNFYCDENNLTSLKGGPRVVGGNFSCTNNPIESLEGGPEAVGGDFNCSYTLITNLKGAPRYVRDTFVCSVRGISSVEDLVGIPDGCGNYHITGTKLTNLQGIDKVITNVNPEKGGTLNFAHNSINSHILGLFRIEGVQHIRIDSVDKDIMNLIDELRLNPKYNANQKIAKAIAEIHRIAKEKNKPELKAFAKL